MPSLHRIGLILGVTVSAGLGAGCGSNAATHRSSRASEFGSAVKVIAAWSSALRRGDVSAAASYFALPSLYDNGGPALVIRTEREAVEVNASLPCGAKVVTAVRQGSYVSVLFRLTDRPGPGGGCGSGTGQLASTNFIVRGGRIVQWIRAEPGGATTPSPAPTVPSSPPGPGASV